MPNVMDTNGEECSLRDYDLVLESPVGYKLVNVLTEPEMVKLVRTAYALPQFDAARALRTFSGLKHTRPGRIKEVLAEVRERRCVTDKAGADMIEVGGTS